MLTTLLINALMAAVMTGFGIVNGALMLLGMEPLADAPTLNTIAAQMLAGLGI